MLFLQVILYTPAKYKMYEIGGMGRKNIIVVVSCLLGILQHQFLGQKCNHT